MKLLETVWCCGKSWTIPARSRRWKCPTCGLELLRSTPPTILCSHCGVPMDKLGGERRQPLGYRCQPCGRTVRP